VLAAAIAALAGYVNNCFTGLGLGPGAAPAAAPAPAKEIAAAAVAVARARIVVQGEQCRLGDAAPRPCDAVCAEVEGAAEVEATAGAQRTVDALRTCLQGRGVKVQVVAE
jgi:hypothetical protein